VAVNDARLLEATRPTVTSEDAASVAVAVAVGRAGAVEPETWSAAVPGQGLECRDGSELGAKALVVLASGLLLRRR
jgi:hypothetical protein